MTLQEMRLSMQDILETAAEGGSFRTFVAAIRSANLASVLQYTRCLTLLAPTDDAFTSLPPGMIRRLLDPRHREDLAELIMAHIFVDVLSLRDLSRRESVKTLGDQILTIEGDELEMTIGQAQVIRGDIVASNGLIHVVDRVILPWTPAECSAFGD
jgi:uncharacterized surface protein with fasciclin (FAS1) repeats